MALVVPFRAVRPHRKYAGEVASFPYDVLDREEGRAIIRDNPRNFLRVEKSEIDVPDEIRDDDPRVFARARENLRNFMKEGILFQDEKPCLYVYKQKAAHREQYGLVGCVSIAEYEAGLIKKHELTRIDKENERVNHIATAGAQTGLVFLLYRSRKAIDRILSGIVKGPPEYDFTTSDGVSHTAWVISESGTIEALQQEFSKVESLYIADGHHRAASAAAVARMRRGKNPAHNGTEEYNTFVATLFSHEQLKILDYNRVVKDLQGMNGQEFLDRIGEKRIAVCYLIAVAVFLRTGVRGQIYWTLALLLGYWLVMAFAPFPVNVHGEARNLWGVFERDDNVSAYVDSVILNGPIIGTHVWRNTAP